MKKEDFKYEDPERYIENKYIFENEDCLITISENIFNEDAINFASTLVEKYKKEKVSIFNYLLDNRLREFYNGRYEDEYVLNNMGKPQINIIFANDGKNPNLTYKYFCSMDFLEHKMDEHIISVEFLDDFKLRDVELNG